MEDYYPAMAFLVSIICWVGIYGCKVAFKDNYYLSAKTPKHMPFLNMDTKFIHSFAKHLLYCNFIAYCQFCLTVPVFVVMYFTKNIDSLCIASDVTLSLQDFQLSSTLSTDVHVVLTFILQSIPTWQNLFPIRKNKYNHCHLGHIT